MKIAVFALVLSLFAAGISSAAQSEILSPLDGAVNAMLGALQAPNRDATRVVPVFGPGGVTRGYAQIVGPQSKVAATHAVAMISTTSPNGWTIDTLIPVSTIARDGTAMHREYGVAVDALVRQGQ